MGKPIYTIYWNKEKTHGIVWSNNIGELMSASSIDAILAHPIEVKQLDFNEEVWGAFPTKEEFDSRKHNLFYIQSTRMEAMMK